MSPYRSYFHLSCSLCLTPYSPCAPKSRRFPRERRTDDLGPGSYNASPPPTKAEFHRINYSNYPEVTRDYYTIHPYTCTCTYTYIHTYIHIHTSIHTYIHLHIHPYIHPYMHAYIIIYLHADLFMFLLACTHNPPLLISLILIDLSGWLPRGLLPTSPPHPTATRYSLDRAQRSLRPSSLPRSARLAPLYPPRLHLLLSTL